MTFSFLLSIVIDELRDPSNRQYIASETYPRTGENVIKTKGGFGFRCFSAHTCKTESKTCKLGKKVNTINSIELTFGSLHPSSNLPVYRLIF